MTKHYTMKDEELARQGCAVAVEEGLVAKSNGRWSITVKGREWARAQVLEHPEKFQSEDRYIACLEDIWNALLG